MKTSSDRDARERAIRTPLASRPRPIPEYLAAIPRRTGAARVVVASSILVSNTIAPRSKRATSRATPSSAAFATTSLYTKLEHDPINSITLSARSAYIPESS